MIFSGVRATVLFAVTPIIYNRGQNKVFVILYKHNGFYNWVICETVMI